MVTTAVAGDEKVDQDEARRVLDTMEKDDKGKHFVGWHCDGSVMVIFVMVLSDGDVQYK